MDTVQLSTPVDSHARIPRSIFISQLAERGFGAIYERSYATEVSATKDMDFGVPVTFHHVDQDRTHQESFILDGDDVLAWVCSYHNYVYLYVSGKSDPVASQLLEDLCARFPKAVAKDNVIPFTFWNRGHNGPEAISRSLEVPRWSEISENYATGTLQILNPLMDCAPPDLNGQLILWRGEPGTGKTYALRALAYEWRKCCDFHYVVDPEEFFGRANYMMHVLLQSSDADRYKLLILEDSGELLSADAKQRTGQGMSRLLNAVDGILGQGLKLMVLVTTNEELKSLHPAVARDGRCAALCEFLDLEPARANEWLEAHGLEPTESKHRSLSELFALTKPKALMPEVQKRPVGFTSDLQLVDAA